MRLDKGEKAATVKGMQHNYDTMRSAGYSKKRSEGTAYGEVGEEKAARRHESKGMQQVLRESYAKRVRKAMK
jgi:hypothetical protein